MSIFQAIGCFLGLHDLDQFWDQYGACRVCPLCKTFERGDMYGWHELFLDFKPFEWWELETNSLKHQARYGCAAAVVNDEGQVFLLSYRRFGPARENQGRWEGEEAGWHIDRLVVA